jgi:mono/diheme cytochrome c family protein
MNERIKADAERNDFRIKVALLVVSLATIGGLTFAALQENVFAEWHRIRARYARVLDEKAVDERGQATADLFRVDIVQNFVPHLGVVDRCVTCHAGIADPRMQDQPQPYTTHPGDYLRIHDPDKFGCTVCHEGQGRATTIDDAHGVVPHWDYPRLAASHVRSSCAKCHLESDLFGEDGLLRKADGDDPSPSAEVLLRGHELAASEGCQGCHKIAGLGGMLGPDLTYVGSKTRHDFDFSHFHHGERQVPDWLEAHFLEPASISPGSLMPPVGNAEDAEALTAYMMSLQPRHAGVITSEADPVTPDSGAALYAKYCSACHGENGEATDVPGINTPALNNLDTLSVAGDDFYRFIVERGRSGSLMPAWGEGHGNLGRDEIDRIVAYIRGWQPTRVRLDDVDSAQGDAREGRAYYRGMCAGCHGVNGEGGIGNALNQATFLSIADDRFLASSILEGRPGTAMPSWRHLSEQTVNDILAYMRRWQAVPPTFDEVSASMRAVPAAQNAKWGKTIYRRDCLGCHGERGTGGIGPSISSPDFLQVADDRYLYEAIVQGRPSTAMPAWRDLSSEDIGSLIAYLRSLQRGPSKSLKPLGLPAGNWETGAVHYDVSCRGCHGRKGSGGVGPQLANSAFLAGATDEMLFYWISNGREMTAMKGFSREAQGPTYLTPGQIVDIIAYLRHVERSRDVPVLRAGGGNDAHGERIYAETCAACHGPNGEGASAPQLNNPAFLRIASDGFLAATIVLGRDGTPMESMVRTSQGLGDIDPDHVPDLIAFMRRWEEPSKWRESRHIAEFSGHSVREGQRKYTEYCSGCHGVNGEGQNGGEGYFAPALNNPEFLAAATDGFLLATIARGRSNTPMRPFGKGAGGIAALDDADMFEIVSFIRSWQTGAEPMASGESK